jgi:protein-tyrosine phosphatase
MALIDLHAHVLPGLDDGPATLDEALSLLRAMANQEISIVVAGAHALPGRGRYACGGCPC